MARLAALCFVAVAACAPLVERPLVAISEATDTDPDPAVVTVDLVAGEASAIYRSDKPATVWAFRDAAGGKVGTVPGPTIRARVGDLLVARITNALPEATTVHWHGVRLPNGMDGSTSSQRKIEPGETFEYRIPFRDTGTFWYHPHVRGDTQIERGLYGKLIVEGGTEVDVAADRYFALDDVKLDASGTLNQDTDELDVMLGRQGNVLLVDGQAGRQLEVARGSRERWRFVNTANGRYFNLSLAGHRFLVIGWDGGLIPQPYETETLLIAPGERYEVLVELSGAVGTRVPLQTLFYDRGHNIRDPGPKDLLELVFSGEATRKPAALPSSWRELPAPAVTPATPVRRFVLKELETAAGVAFVINDEVWPFNTPVEVKQGDTEIWEVDNQVEMDHPFHLHGMFFDVLNVGAAPFERAGWKDTVNVPQKTALRFAVRYEPEGIWMFHCHILEHAERGMMGDLRVMP